MDSSASSAAPAAPAKKRATKGKAEKNPAVSARPPRNARRARDADKTIRSMLAMDRRTMRQKTKAVPGFVPQEDDKRTKTGDLAGSTGPGDLGLVSAATTRKDTRRQRKEKESTRLESMVRSVLVDEGDEIVGASGLDRGAHSEATFNRKFARMHRQRNEADAAARGNKLASNAQSGPKFTRDDSNRNARSLSAADYRALLASNRLLRQGLEQHNRALDGMAKNCTKVRGQLSKIIKRRQSDVSGINRHRDAASSRALPGDSRLHNILNSMQRKQRQGASNASRGGGKRLRGESVRGGGGGTPGTEEGLPTESSDGQRDDVETTAGRDGIDAHGVASFLDSVYGPHAFRLKDKNGEFVYPKPNADMVRVARAYETLREMFRGNSACGEGTDPEAGHIEGIGGGVLGGIVDAGEESDYDSDGNDGGHDAGKDGRAATGLDNKLSVVADDAFQWRAVDIARLHTAVLSEMRAGLAMSLLSASGVSSRLFDASLDIDMSRVEAMDTATLLSQEVAAEKHIDWKILASRYMSSSKTVHVSAEECRKRWIECERRKFSSAPSDLQTEADGAGPATPAIRSDALAVAAVNDVAEGSGPAALHIAGGGVPQAERAGDGLTTDAKAAHSAGIRSKPAGQNFSRKSLSLTDAQAARLEGMLRERALAVARRQPHCHRDGGGAPCPDTEACGEGTTGSGDQGSRADSMRLLLDIGCEEWKNISDAIGVTVAACAKHYKRMTLRENSEGTKKLTEKASAADEAREGKQRPVAKRKQTRKDDHLFRQSGDTNPYVTNGEWSEREVMMLLASRCVFGEDVGLVSQCMGSRNYEMCRRKLQKMDKQEAERKAKALGLRGGPPPDWGPDLDELLLETVASVGTKWTEVSKRIRGRNADSCRHRYKRITAPGWQQPGGVASAAAAAAIAAAASAAEKAKAATQSCTATDAKRKREESTRWSPEEDSRLVAMVTAACNSGLDDRVAPAVELSPGEGCDKSAAESDSAAAAAESAPVGDGSSKTVSATGCREVDF